MSGHRARRGHRRKQPDRRQEARPARFFVSSPRRAVRCQKCDGKILHKTRAAASQHVHRLAATESRQTIMRLQIYRCRHQDRFHVGHLREMQSDPATRADRPPHPFWCDACGAKAPFAMRGCAIEHLKGCERRGENPEVVYQRAADWCRKTGEAIP